MASSRDVHITIGKGRYCIRTPLGDDVLARMKDLIDQAYGTPARGMDQEDLLTLTCLKLAYSLDSVAEQVNALVALLDSQEGAQEAREKS